MTHRLKIGILATICFWSFVCSAPLRAQEVSEYSTLMQEADQFLADSKVDEARLRYAQALQKEASDTEKTQTALFLAMTFEKDGTFQEAECRGWATKQLLGKQERDWVERGIQEYRQKFLGEIPMDDTTVYALRSPMPTGQSSDMQEEVEPLIYAGLMKSGEELSLQGRYEEARLAFAKALALESEKDILSHSAMGIAASFRSKEGLDVDACKKWAEANVPVVRDRLRIALAVGEFFYRKQDYDQAITNLDKVIKEKGSIADMASLIVALSLLGQGKGDTALAELNRIAAESSSKEVAAKAMFLVGWAHLREQEYVAAKKAFEKLLREYPESQFTEKAIALKERLKPYTE